jgi:hypothetical protein
MRLGFSWLRISQEHSGNFLKVLGARTRRRISPDILVTQMGGKTAERHCTYFLL